VQLLIDRPAGSSNPSRGILLAKFVVRVGPTVLAPFSQARYRPPMSDADEKLTPADPRDLAAAIAFALQFEGRRRIYSAEEYMAAIAAERVVRHLERAGFVILRKPPLGGHSAIGRGFEG
jgi:hypothetical protein